MTWSGWSRGVVIRALTGVLIIGTLACGDSDPEGVDSQREAWESVRPSRYRFDYTVTGFAPGRGPWRIEVNGERAVSVAYVGQGDTPTPGLTEATAPTIETLFDQTEEALDDSSVEVTVRYDSHWHHPAEASFDSGEEASGFRAENLAPLD